MSEPIDVEQVRRVAAELRALLARTNRLAQPDNPPDLRRVWGLGHEAVRLLEECAAQLETLRAAWIAHTHEVLDTLEADLASASAAQPAPEPRRPGFWRQLWLALTRDTPAFGGGTGPGGRHRAGAKQ